MPNRVLLLWLTISVCVRGAATDPAPLSADLSRYYFASPEREVAARAELDNALARLEAWKGRVSSGPALLHALEAYEAVQRVFRRHEGYLHLRCSLDRKDPSCEANRRLAAEVDARTAFLEPEVLALAPDRLQAFEAAEPALARYAFAVDDMRRETGHLLPASEQALLDRFGPDIADWQYDLYQEVVADIPFGVVQTNAGPLDVFRQRRMLAANPDAHVREEAFRRRMGGWTSRRDLLAFALIHTVTAQQALSRTHHYPDAPARKYLGLYLDAAQTRNLLDQMARHGNVAKRFERIRGRDFESAYGKPMQAWDLSAPPPGLTPPPTALGDAARVFHEAFSGLGADYQAAFDELLDPASGRADVLPGGAPDRYPGGFSIGFAGSPSVLFVGRYDGAFKDLSVIAHEGGHAVHRSLMNSHDVAPIYADGPNFLSESVAVFNELLLADHLAEHAADPQLRRYYREQWMGIKGLDAFYGAKDALLEQQIYDGVSAGTIRGADDLDRVTVTVDSQFSTFPSLTPELRTRWAEVSLMFEDPLYDVNYVYGGLLALRYFHLYTVNREDFVPRYVALLKNGFDRPPAQLLREFLGIELSDPSLLVDGLQVLDQRLGRLEGRE